MKALRKRVYNLVTITTMKHSLMLEYIMAAERLGLSMAGKREVDAL